jgi:hypothetical protein
MKCPHCSSDAFYRDIGGNLHWACGSNSGFRSAACMDRATVVQPLIAEVDRLRDALKDLADAAAPFTGEEEVRRVHVPVLYDARKHALRVLEGKP